MNFNSPTSAPTPPYGTPQAQLPTTGDEIYKTRPAVVINIPVSLNLEIAIVVPITTWQPRFQTNNYVWMVKILADPANHLAGDSAANIFQIKSASFKRFSRKIGVLTTQQMDTIAATCAYYIGYTPLKAPPTASLK